MANFCVNLYSKEYKDIERRFGKISAMRLAKLHVKSEEDWKWALKELENKYEKEDIKKVIKELRKKNGGIKKLTLEEAKNRKYEGSRELDNMSPTLRNYLVDTIISYMLGITPENADKILTSTFNLDLAKVTQFFIDKEKEAIEQNDPAYLFEVKQLSTKESIEKLKNLVAIRLAQYFDIEEAEGDQLAKMLGNIIKDSVEINPTKNARASIKIWLSLIPDVDGMKRLPKEIGAQAKFITPFIPLSDIITRLQDTLGDTIQERDSDDILKEMLKKLGGSRYSLATFYPPARYIYNKLRDPNTSEKFKTEFVRTFNLYTQNFTSFFKQERTKTSNFGGMSITEKVVTIKRFRHKKMLDKLHSIASFWAQQWDNRLNRTIRKKENPLDVIEEYKNEVTSFLAEIERELRELKTKNHNEILEYYNLKLKEKGYHFDTMLDLQHYLAGQVLNKAGFPINEASWETTKGIIASKVLWRKKTSEDDDALLALLYEKGPLSVAKSLAMVLFDEFDKMKEALESKATAKKKYTQYKFNSLADIELFEIEGRKGAPYLLLSLYASTLSASFQESFASFDGNTYYPHSTGDFITRESLEKKAKTDRKSLPEGMSTSGLETEYILGVRDEETASSSKELDILDDLVMRLIADDYRTTEKSKVPFLPLADKSRYYMMSGFSTEIFDAGIVDGITELLLEDAKKIVKAYRNVFGIDGEGKRPIEELVEGWHYKRDEHGNIIFRDENGYPVGDFFQQSLWAEFKDSSFLYQEGEKGLPNFFEDYINFTVDNDTFEKIGDTHSKRIKETLSDIIIEDLIEAGFLEQTEEGTYKFFEGAPLREIRRVLEKRTGGYEDIPPLKQYGNTKEDLKYLINLFMRHTIAHYMQMHLFYGHVGFFKTFTNFMKRTPGASGTGEYLRIHKTKWGEVRPTYQLALMTNKFKEDSKLFADSIYENIKKVLEGHEAFDSIVEGLEETQEEYEAVNKMDAQGVISPERWKEIAMGLYGWSDELEKAFQQAKKGKATQAQIALLLQHLPLGSLKGQHYELVEHNGEQVPIYIKYSQFPLFPQLVTFVKGEDYAKLMKLSGVDELVVIDGSKGAQILVNDIDDPGKALQEGVKLRSISLRNKYWKLQQEVPYHAEDKTVVGVQVRRNVLANLEHPVQLPNGEELSPEEFADEVMTIDAHLSTRSSSLVLQEFGVEHRHLGKHGYYVMKEDKFYEKLTKLYMKDDDVNETTLRLLKNKLPLDGFGSLIKQIENKIFAAIRKAALRFKERGNAYVQVSPELFDRHSTRMEQANKTYADLTDTEKKGVVWLKDKAELDPPQLVEGEDGKMHVTYGQVLLPAAYFKSLPKYEKYRKRGNKALSKYILETVDPETLQLIAYRIPNQKLSFTQPVEIVGILPEEVGNTIVAYSEIAVQTGSDYDIDKLFTFMPYLEWDKESKKLRPIQYLTDENSTVEERYERMKKEWLKSDYAQEKLREFEKNLKIAQRAKESLIDKIFHLSVNNQIVRSKLGALDGEVLERLQDETITFMELREVLDELEFETRFLDDVAPEGTEDREVLEEILKRIKKEALNDSYKEFVDKLLIEMQEMDLIPSIEVFGTMSLHEQNTKEALSNKKLMLYKSLLTTPEYYTQLISSVDTSFLKDNIKQLYEDEERNGLMNFSSVRLAMIRKEFMNSKHGVGGTANAQADAIYYQYYNATAKSELYTTEYKIKKNDDGSITYKKYRKILTTDILSAFMNAFVDAAKDNYIGKARVSPETQSTVYHLVVKRGAASIVPILLLKNNEVKQYLTHKNKWKRVFLQNKFSSEYKESFELSEEETKSAAKIVREMMKLHGENLTETILDFINDEEVSDNIKNKVFLDLWREFEKEAREEQPVQSHNKIDVNGAEKKTSEMLVKLMSFARISDEDWQRKQATLTHLTAFQRNTFNAIFTLLGHQRFILSQAGLDLIDEMLNELHTLDKEEALSEIDNEILTALAVTQLRKTLGWSDEEIASLFVGETSVTSRIAAYLEKRATSGQNVFRGKEILSSLRYRLKGNTDIFSNNIPRLTRIERTPSEKADLTTSWEQLFLGDEEEAQLALDLAVVAIMSYGIGGGQNNLAAYIPNIILNALGLTGKDYSDFLEEVRTGTYNYAIKRQIVQHLARKSRVIKTLPKRMFRAISEDGEHTGHFFVKKGDIKNYSQGSRPPKYIRVAVKIGQEERTQLLERVVDVVDMKNINPNPYGPEEKVVVAVIGYVYKVVPRMGRNNRYNTLVFREYNLLDVNHKSISSVNRYQNPYINGQKQVREETLLKAAKEMGRDGYEITLVKARASKLDLLQKSLKRLGINLPHLEEAERLYSKKWRVARPSERDYYVTENETKQEFEKNTTPFNEVLENDVNSPLDTSETLPVESGDVEQSTPTEPEAFDIGIGDPTQTMSPFGDTFTMKDDVPPIPGEPSMEELEEMGKRILKDAQGTSEIPPGPPEGMPLMTGNEFTKFSERQEEKERETEEKNTDSEVDKALEILDDLEVREEIEDTIDEIYDEGKNIEELKDDITNKLKDDLEDGQCGGKGTPKASKGFVDKFTPGGRWEIVKDLKGLPSHKEGGVDLNISNGRVSFRKGDSNFEAKYGLIIKRNKQ